MCNDGKDRSTAVLKYLSKERCRTDSGVCRTGESFLSTLAAGDTVWEWELNTGLGELHRVGTLQVLGCNGGSSDDLDGTRTATVTTGHFIVQLRDCAGQGDVTKFTVHIVCARPGLVPQPDAVVLNDTVVLLHDFYNIQNFTRRLLHLSELMHVIPELRLGDHSVRCEDDHPVRLGVGMVLGGGFAADHLEMFHDARNCHSTRGRNLERKINWG